MKCPTIDAGWSSPVAREAHNLEVVGSNPTPAIFSKRVACECRTQLFPLAAADISEGVDVSLPDRKNSGTPDGIFAVEYLLGHCAMPSPTEPLKLNEVGAYGNLIARPNPDGLVVLAVPPFESLLPFIAHERGRELTSDDIENERKRAPSIVLTKEAAQQVAAARARER